MDKSLIARISEADQVNVEQVVDTFLKWVNGDFARDSETLEARQVQNLREYDLTENYFFSGYLVGSILNPKVKPNDTDLLIATNLFPNNGYMQPKFNDLLTALSKNNGVAIKMVREGKMYGVNIDPRTLEDFSVEKFMIGMYAAEDCTKVKIKHYDKETDSRVTIKLKPIQPGLMPMDLIYQWNIINQTRWEAHEATKQDKEPFKRIFSIGPEHPKGYGEAVRDQYGGRFGLRIPEGEYRIKTPTLHKKLMS